MKNSKIQIGLFLLATLFGLFTLSSFIDEDEGSGGPSQCLNIHTETQATEANNKMCYRDVVGTDIFEGYTKVCNTGSGACNKVTCDKAPDKCYEQ